MIPNLIQTKFFLKHIFSFGMLLWLRYHNTTLPKHKCWYAHRNTGMQRRHVQRDTKFKNRTYFYFNTNIAKGKSMYGYRSRNIEIVGS